MLNSIKYGRLGLEYNFKSFDTLELNNEKIVGLGIILELTVINKKTNREIIFISRKNEVPSPCLKVMRKLENSDFDYSGVIFFNEYIKVNLKNKKVEILVKNKELSEFDIEINYKIKEANKIIIIGKSEIGNMKINLAENKKIHSEEFYNLLKYYNDKENLILGTINFYEINIKK